MTIAQVSAKWTGLSGGDGYSFIYLRSTAASPGGLQAFFEAIKTKFPQVLNIQVPASGRLIDETNGKMTGVWGAGVTATTTGTSTSGYAPSQGAQVKWATNNFVNGRRVWGRNYLVPLAASFYGTNGLIFQVDATAIQTAATNMISAYTGNMVVWSRPVFVLDADGKPTEEIKRAGSIHTITTATVPVKAVQLKGRRDQ